MGYQVSEKKVSIVCVGGACMCGCVRGWVRVCMRGWKLGSSSSGKMLWIWRLI